jgi:hypothetical protein
MKGFDLNGWPPCKEDWIAASTIESVEMLSRPDGKKGGSGPASNSYGEGIEHTQAIVFQRRFQVNVLWLAVKPSYRRPIPT